MPLRFSIKWLLLAVVYVAIAGAAFKQGWWLWADLLWGIAWFAFASALLNVWLREAAARAGAVGCAILMACYGLSAMLAPASLPTERILWASGLDLTGAGFSDDSFRMLSSLPVYSPGYTKVGGSVGINSFTQYTATLRAAHSVAAMVAGLSGYWLGLWVWLRSRGIQPTVAPPADP